MQRREKEQRHNLLLQHLVCCTQFMRQWGNGKAGAISASVPALVMLLPIEHAGTACNRCGSPAMPSSVTHTQGWSFTERQDGIISNTPFEELKQIHSFSQMCFCLAQPPKSRTDNSPTPYNTTCKSKSQRQTQNQFFHILANKQSTE